MATRSSVDEEVKSLVERLGSRFSLLSPSLYRITLDKVCLDIYLPWEYPDYCVPEVSLTWRKDEEPLFSSAVLQDQMTHLWESSEHLPVLLDLVEWIENMSDTTHKKDDAEEYDIKPNPDRQLVIYTWGDQVQKAPPPHCEKNFNAKCLNCRGGGVDLRTMNGTWPELQAKVKSCSAFRFFAACFIKAVETGDLKVVSVNCSKGRHRCASFAEVMREHYPCLIVHHRSIGVTTTPTKRCLRTPNRKSRR